MRARAVSRTYTISNRKIWLRSPSRPQRWRGCLWPVPIGFRGAARRFRKSQNETPRAVVARKGQGLWQRWVRTRKKRGIKYFLVSFVDLFGAMRAKIAPATAIDMIAKSGAGFAGFAVWFDITPAHPDVLVMADADSVIQLPWKPEVAWVTGDLVMEGKPVAQNPRQVLKRVVAAAAAEGFDMKSGVECEYFFNSARRKDHFRCG